MAPDPALGDLSEPTPASGYDLRALGLGGATLPPARPSWQNRYARSVVACDVAAVAAACSAGLVLGNRITELGDGFQGALVGPVVAVLLLVATYLVGAWDRAVLGDGSAEYRRLVRGYAATSTVLGLAGLAARLDEVGPWVFGIVPAACVLAIVGRLALRKALHRRRALGECTFSVLAVGGEDAVADLIVRTRRDRHRGWTVTAACTPTGTGSILGVPVVGDLDAAAAVARRGKHPIVSVASGPGLSPVRLHRLAWDIEGFGAELVVDPRLTEVAGPRLRAEPVDGLPLLRMTRPTLSRARLLVKTLVDRLGAGLLLLLLAPLLLALAVAIRSGGGPVLDRQTHIGRDGKPFTLLRFRSRVAGADRRITTVGAWMHRYSLDALPELLNVLGGSMSIVGPRPERAPCLRTLPVKPGLTGLWQVNGGADLSREESAQLELRYVQNWSLTRDATILWRTFRAVGRRADA